MGKRKRGRTGKRKSLDFKGKNRLSKQGYNINENIPLTEGLVIFDIVATTGYSTKEQHLVYKLRRFYKPDRAKLFKVAKRDYSSFEDMMNKMGELSSSYHDDKCYEDTITGYVLKN
jgi:hypothetical protein